MDDAARGHQNDSLHAGGAGGVDDAPHALLVGVEEHPFDAVEGGCERGRVGQVRGADIDTVGELSGLGAAGGCPDRNATCDQLREDVAADAAACTHDEGLVVTRIDHAETPDAYVPRAKVPIRRRGVPTLHLAGLKVAAAALPANVVKGLRRSLLTA